MYPQPDILLPDEPEPPPSLTSRFGQRVANALPDTLNQLMSLAHLAGVRAGDQPEPAKVPLFYDVPEATTGGEMAVDVGAELIGSLPLFLSGEGAGLGIARLAKAGPTVTNMLRLGGAFGTAGLVESPAHGVVEGGLGGVMGGIERILPRPARFAAAAGLGLATAGVSKLEGGSNTEAGIAGAVNTLMPLMFGRGARRLARAEALPPATPPPIPKGIHGKTLAYLEQRQAQFGEAKVNDAFRAGQEPLNALEPTFFADAQPGRFAAEFRSPEEAERWARRNKDNIVSYTIDQPEAGGIYLRFRPKNAGLLEQPYGRGANIGLKRQANPPPLPGYQEEIGLRELPPPSPPGYRESIGLAERTPREYFNEIRQNARNRASGADVPVRAESGEVKPELPERGQGLLPFMMEGRLIRDAAFNEEQARTIAQAKGDDFVRDFFRETKAFTPQEMEAALVHNEAYNAPLVASKAEPPAAAAATAEEFGVGGSETTNVLDDFMRRYGPEPRPSTRADYLRAVAQEEAAAAPVSRGEGGGVSPRMEVAPLQPEVAGIKPPEAPVPPRTPEPPRAPTAPRPPTPEEQAAIYEHVKKLNLRVKNEGGFVNPEIFHEVAAFGQSIYQKGKDFTTWAKEMVSHFGKQIKQHLETIWDSFTGKNIFESKRESGSVGGTGGSRKGTTRISREQTRLEILEREGEAYDKEAVAKWRKLPEDVKQAVRDVQTYEQKFEAKHGRLEYGRGSGTFSGSDQAKSAITRRENKVEKLVDKYEPNFFSTARGIADGTGRFGRFSHIQEKLEAPISFAEEAPKVLEEQKLQTFYQKFQSELSEKLKNSLVETDHKVGDIVYSTASGRRFEIMSAKGYVPKNGRMLLAVKDVFTGHESHSYADMMSKTEPAIETLMPKYRDAAIAQGKKAKVATSQSGEKPTSSPFSPENAPPPDGGGMKLGGSDKAGGTTYEALESLTKFVGAPVGGLIGGAALPADSNTERLEHALMGMVVVGGLAIGGFAAARRMVAAHPEIGGAKSAGEKIAKFGGAMKDDALDLAKAVTANPEMAAKVNKRWDLSSDYDKLARWLERAGTTNPAATRFLSAARGVVNEYARDLHTAIHGLTRMDNISSYFKPLNEFFEGVIDLAQLQRLVPAEVSALASTATQARTGLQDIVVAGLGTNKLSAAIKKSIDNYLTTSYKIFHDPKYYPTDLQVEVAAKSLGSKWGDLKIVIEDIHNYLQEIKAGKAIWGGGEMGKSLGALLARQKVLPPEFKAMLGEYDNPLQRMAFTATKLVTGARSAEYFNEVAKGAKVNGLKYAYGREERAVLIATLQQQAKLSHTPELRAEAQAKLDDLSAYLLNTNGPTTGRLSNQYIDRRMHDQLANYTFDVKALAGPMAQGFLDLTNGIKYGQVILSPLQLVRQVYQLPIMGLLGRTSPADWARAGATIFDKSAAGQAELKRLRMLGVFEGTSQVSELREDIKSLMVNSFDNKIKRAVKEGLHKWEEVWKTPDQIIRLASFQRMEKRLLEKYGASGAERATMEAIDHMNRYTMNYAAVPPLVKIGRQLPFINQYLSFAWEMARITKNHMQDAMKGDLYSIGALGVLATAPFVIQQMSEANLSEEDNKEWQRVKSLGRDYERHNFRFVMGRNPNGDFRYVSFSPLVPHDPYLQTIRATMAGDTDAALSVNPVFGWENTPLLNVATTLVSHRNRYTGQKLQGVGEHFGEIRRSVAPIVVGTDLDRLIRAITPNEEGGRGQIDTRTGKVSSLGDMLQTYATSMRPYTVRPAYLIKQAKMETIERINHQRRIYRSIKNTNATPEAKAQALEHFQNTKKQILLSFKEKIGAEEPATVLSGE